MSYCPVVVYEFNGLWVVDVEVPELSKSKSQFHAFTFSDASVNCTEFLTFPSQSVKLYPLVVDPPEASADDVTNTALQIDLGSFWIVTSVVAAPPIFTTKGDKVWLDEICAEIVFTSPELSAVLLCLAK